MVENTIRTVEGGKDVPFKAVTASRGKAVRAEPIAALYEKGRVHHVGELTGLEDEMCNWVPGESPWSPNRLDAAVWALTELMLDQAKEVSAW
jgi:phage terminase large subunit-like protein